MKILNMLTLIASLVFITPSYAAEKIYFVHTDHLGTPQALTDDTQTVVWKAGEDPFGNDAPVIEQVTNNIRFPGQYYDSETGLHYNWNRYYDAGVGRYVTSDPIGLDGGLNTFGYVYGNPLVYSDPNGLVPAVAACAAVPACAAGAIAVGGAITNAILGNPIGNAAGDAVSGIGSLMDSDGNPEWPIDPDAPAPWDGPAPEQCNDDGGDNCDAIYAVDTSTCNGISKFRGGEAGARCHASAALRLAACIANRPLPPLDTWNN